MSVIAEIDASGERIVLTCEWRWKELCASLPGSSWNVKERYWSVPLSWTTCLALRSTFLTALEIGPNLSAWAVNELNTWIEPAATLRDLEDYEGDADLFPHQRAGVAYLKTVKRAILADEPGLGKTAQAIRALRTLEAEGTPVLPALIVCPNTLKKPWVREFEKWWPGIRTQVIKGTATQRRKQFANPDVDVIIMNWESVRSHSRLAPYGSVALVRCVEHGGEDPKISATRCEVHLGELNHINFQAVIADEIHRSKDPKSKQTRALWAATGDAPIRFALTGTPIGNDVADLWSILHWLSPEDWPGKTKWMARMVDSVLNAFGVPMVIGVKPAMQAEFYRTINPRMRRMLKARVLKFLPPIIYERRDVEMSTKQKKAYEQMREHMIAELENERGENALTASTALTQTMRLMQFASAYCEVEKYWDTDQYGNTVEKQKVKLIGPSCKVDELMADIKGGDFGDDAVAVCAVSRQLIELLSEAMTKAHIKHGLITGDVSEDERQQAIDDFQSGKIKWILFTVQAGGVGVTLTAARRLVRLQRPWSLIDDIQALNRVHRIGSEIHDSIIVMDYVTEGTVEEKVLQVLDEKGESFEEVVQDRVQLLKMLKEDKAALV